MNYRDEARAQALEEMGDNVAHLGNIEQYCSGWQRRDEAPGPGCITLFKNYEFPGGEVQARIEVMYRGSIRIEVRDIT